MEGSSRLRLRRRLAPAVASPATSAARTITALALNLIVGSPPKSLLVPASKRCAALQPPCFSTIGPSTWLCPGDRLRLLLHTIVGISGPHRKRYTGRIPHITRYDLIETNLHKSRCPKVLGLRRTVSMKEEPAVIRRRFLSPHSGDMRTGRMRRTCKHPQNQQRPRRCGGGAALTLRFRRVAGYGTTVCALVIQTK